jgi:hypothetical protein
MSEAVGSARDRTSLLKDFGPWRPPAMRVSGRADAVTLSVSLVAALDLDRIPRPLHQLLTKV